MPLTKKLRRFLLDIRVKAYKIGISTQDLLVMNYMDAVVEYADKARREDNRLFAELALRNWETGQNRIKEIEKND